MRGLAMQLQLLRSRPLSSWEQVAVPLCAGAVLFFIVCVYRTLYSFPSGPLEPPIPRGESTVPSVDELLLTPPSGHHHQQQQQPVSTMMTKVDKKVTMVLPCTLNDVAQLLFLFRSLDKFATAEHIHKLLLVVPDSKAWAFAALAWDGRPASVPVVIVPESSILGELPTSVSGDDRQMAIKLMVARVVETEFYVTLDADLLLRAPFVYDKLIEGGKATYNPEPYAVHAEWWAHSEQLLGWARPSEAEQEACCFGVTPQILHRHISLLTLQRLEERYGQQWLAYAGETYPHWSEYTSYFLTAVHYRLFGKYHKYMGYGVYDAGASIWSAQELQEDSKLEGLMKGGDRRSPFVLIQSILHVPPNKLAEMLRPFFDEDHTQPR